MPTPALLRHIEPGDIAVFYDHQADPQSAAMAAVTIRDRRAHEEQWAKIMVDPAAIIRTVVVGDDGTVAGSVTSFMVGEKLMVGYRIGQKFWGRGLATRALAEFLDEVHERPLYADVAEHNLGSLKVLQRNNFQVVGEFVDDGLRVHELRLD